MPQHIDEAQGGDGVNGTQQVSASSADADVVITKVDGDWNIKLRIAAPLQGQITDGRDSGGATSQEMNVAFNGTLRLQDDESADMLHKKWFKEMRGWLMVLATVAASVTYQAGLNPPGGFWQDNLGHDAGNPVLRDERRSRYLTFYYFNATAFVTSLVIMVLLMSERFYHTENKLLALLFTTFVDLASLVGAYIAGTTRYSSSCVYVIVITCVAFVGVIQIGEGMPEICVFVIRKFPCMEKVAQSSWCPIPAGMVQKANTIKDERQRRHDERKRRNSERKQRSTESTSNSGTRCLCCACARSGVAA